MAFGIWKNTLLNGEEIDNKDKRVLAKNFAELYKQVHLLKSDMQDGEILHICNEDNGDDITERALVNLTDYSNLKSSIEKILESGYWPYPVVAIHEAFIPIREPIYYVNVFVELEEGVNYSCEYGPQIDCETIAAKAFQKFIKNNDVKELQLLYNENIELEYVETVEKGVIDYVKELKTTNTDPICENYEYVRHNGQRFTCYVAIFKN